MKLYILLQVIPSKSNIEGITLFPFILTKKNPNKELIQHEEIHIRQQLQLLIIFFYLWYVIEWGVKSLILKKDAYRYISFEKEAYCNEKDPSYRKFFGWIKYLLYIKRCNNDC